MFFINYQQYLINNNIIILNKAYSQEFLSDIMQRRQPVSVCQLFFRSPFTIMNRQSEAQSFPQMLKNLLAPYYKIKSLTTVLMCIAAIIYITLAFRNPPFIKIPAFSLDYLTLQPQNLKHYQFYRLFTSPFVFSDITTLVIWQIVVWSLGSWTQNLFGLRMFIVFTCFSGLIGFSSKLTIPCFLIGCNFAAALMSWPNPNIPILYRKITLIVYFILCLVYVLLFISQQNEQRWSIYSATLYGFLLSFIIGCEKDGTNLSTFRKVMQLVSGLLFIILTSMMIILIVFNRYTII